jgi:hypothetical protein
VFLGQRQAGRVVQCVLHQHEHQFAAAPGLVFDRLDAGHPLGPFAHPQRVGHLPMQPAAGPHAARQRHRRQKAAALGVAVGAEFALAVARQKVQPVP